MVETFALTLSSPRRRGPSDVRRNDTVGTLPSIGYKFDRWVDSVFMQRVLGEGSATPPAHEGS